MSTQRKTGVRTRAPRQKEHGAARPNPLPSKGAPAVFLDRDGTICEEVGYVNHLDRIHLFPWSAEAIRKLNQAGLPVIVVTNQSGVGRGYFSEELVKQANLKIAMELAHSDARLEAFYYCPHHPTATVEEYRKACRCRKPLTGMLEEAAKRFNLDLKSSHVVGDSYRDAQLAFNSGARAIMVMTGYGKGEYEHHRKSWPRMPHMVAENLLEAVEKILNGRALQSGGVRPLRSGTKSQR
jgi:D-glycero-D-manno-heptose 1,7-bisphosphate phosphatase